MLAIIGYSYWQTLAAMAEIWWRSDTYAHGFLVPVISAWLSLAKSPPARLPGTRHLAVAGRSPGLAGVRLAARRP